jgi:hypothetical protein
MSTLLKLAALALTGLALVPSGAHFFEMPAKIALDRHEYFVVQGIYAGWILFAIPIFGAIAANLGVYLVERRRDRIAASYALIAAALVAVSLGVFFIWVFPGNQETANWTEMTADWQDLRQAWEYGHAVNAGLMFGALLAVGRSLIGCRTDLAACPGASIAQASRFRE